MFTRTKSVGIVKDIQEINKRLCSDICHLTNSEDKVFGLSPRLILPSSQKVTRISEQEARVLYTSILNSTNYFYSIETPTENKYQFTGNTPISARSDLSLYVIDDNQSFQKVVNVEFKAHNPHEVHIEKDIEKLIKEEQMGNWVHLLKNSDRGTLPALFSKFINSLEKHRHHISKPLSICFCICILEKKVACLKHYYFDPTDNVNFNEYTNTFFQLDYNEAFIANVNMINEWSILK